jgi:hypothetical protein
MAEDRGDNGLLLVVQAAERYHWLVHTSDTNTFKVIDTHTQRLYFGPEADRAIDEARRTL